MRKKIFSRASVYNSIHPGDAGLSVLFGGAPNNAAGVTIDTTTAMTISAVYAAVTIISETVAMLPWNVYRRKGDGHEIATNDPRQFLLHNKPNRYQTSFEFREMMMSHLLLSGRAVAEIITNQRGKITDLLPLQPGSYTAFRATDGTIAFDVGGRILLADEVVDLRGHPDPRDSLQCISPIRNAVETLGISKAADKYAGSFFGNGTVVGGVLQTDAALTDQAYARLKKWTERHQGVGRSHNPAILEEGLKWTQTSLNAEDAQLIQTRKFQVDDVARIYRIPSYKLNSMDRASFNNVEQQSIDFVRDTILPRTVRLEQAITRGIFTDLELVNMFNEIKINGLMRGDSVARSEFYYKMWSMGVYSINDIRRLESENPVVDGDRRFVPVNFTPIDKIDEVKNDGTKI